MDSESDLCDARQRLIEALGQNTSEYFKAMKSWFRDEITKEDFDRRARKLFDNDNVHLHNQFLLSILTKCQIRLTTRPPEMAKQRMFQRIRTKRQPLDFEHAFEPVPVLSSDTVPEAIVSLPPGTSAPELCIRQGILPDSSMIYGRSFVVAWENGLQDVTQSAANLIVVAMENFLKNLLQSVISNRRSYLLEEHRFPHMFGAKTVRKGGPRTPGSMNYAICPPQTLIGVQDLIDVLQLEKDNIRSHQLRTIFLERLLYLSDR